MTIKQIVYQILEEVRQGMTVDDERLSKRLLEDLIHIKRSEFIIDTFRGDLEDSAELSLTMEVDLEADYSSTSVITRSIQDIPELIVNKFCDGLIEVASLDLMAYPFTIINFNHLRTVGFGTFSSNSVFTALKNNKLYFSSGTNNFRLLEKCLITIIPENPEDVPGFDLENDPYPIGLDGIAYIKDELFKKDLNVFFNGRTDEDSDSSGELK